MIPKIIHQTWKTHDIPEKWKESPESIEKHYPDHMYILWSDDDLRNLIKTKFEWFLETYDNYKYDIQRVDASRYFFLYEYGGFIWI